jgi:hypothetical protein
MLGGAEEFILWHWHYLWLYSTEWNYHVIFLEKLIKTLKTSTQDSQNLSRDSN